MAGVSRGCWPAQGGLLPGLLVASMTEAVVVCRGPRRRGQGCNQLTSLLNLLQAAGHIWSPRIWKGFWEQTGHQQTSTSRVSGYRGPQQGVSEACVSPIWKQIHWQQGCRGLMTIAWSDHNTAPSPDRAETDSGASSKDRKRSCQSSFAGVHSSPHLMRFTAMSVMCGRFSVQNVRLQRVCKMSHSRVPEALSTSFINAPPSASRLFYTVQPVSFITLLTVNIVSPSLGFLWETLLILSLSR